MDGCNVGEGVVLKSSLEMVRIDALIGMRHVPSHFVGDW
jgi:hypothetical protein